MKLQFKQLYFLTSLSIAVTTQSFAAPAAPVVTHSINGLTVTVSWTSVPGITKYKLLYAPFPYTGPDTISSLEISGQTSFSAALWEGAAFYIAVQADDGNNLSEYSNIENFTISTSTANLNGYWRITETQGPNNCGEAVGITWSYSVILKQEKDKFSSEGDFVTVESFGGIYGSLDNAAGRLVGNTIKLGPGNGSYYADKLDVSLSVLSENEISGSASSYESVGPEGDSCSSTNTIKGVRE